MRLIGDAAQRGKAQRVVQIVFGAACVAVAAPLILHLGPAATVTNGTSIRVLGAALLALALGAFAAAKDPPGHRVVLRMEIVFSTLSAGFLILRLLRDHIAHDRAWIVLVPLVACLALLIVLYPREAAGSAPPSR
jgi:hypothetical protein